MRSAAQHRLAARDRARVVELGEELETLRLAGPPPLEAALPAIRELLEVEHLLAYCPTERVVGFELGLFHYVGDCDAVRFARTMQRFLAHAPQRFGAYDVLRPERPQRNRLLEPIRTLPRDVFDELALTRELLDPMGLRRHGQLRALVCEDDVLLAWFGALHTDAFDARQRRILSALLPSVERALGAHRRLGGGRRLEAALDVTLEAVAAPAFVLRRDGGIVLANAAGRAMLEKHARSVRGALRDAALRRPSALACEMRPIRGSGHALGWLAIVRHDAARERTRDRAAAAAARWGATPRQREVLELLVRGMSTATISATLGIAERTVELHVTALFDRAGVETRAALVATVLAAG